MIFTQESEDEKPKKRRGGAASNIVSGKRTRTPVKRDGAIVDNEDFDDEEEVILQLERIHTPIESRLFCPILYPFFHTKVTRCQKNIHNDQADFAE